MFNDLIQTEVQFAKIDYQPNHVLLQLQRQLKDNQKFQNHPSKLGVRIIDKLPTTTWNLKDFLVPSRRKKPPQGALGMMPEPLKVKDRAIGQFMV